MSKKQCLVTYRREGILYGGRYEAGSMLEAAAMCLEATQLEGLPGPWPEVLEVTVLATQKRLRATEKAARVWRRKQVVGSFHPKDEPPCFECWHGPSWHSATRCEHPQAMLYDTRCMCRGLRLQA